MFTYAAASHYWRVIPTAMAAWAWQRRGRSLIERTVRNVPAYGGLVRIFSQPTGGTPVSEDMPRLQTCRRSYVQVFPLDQRCRRGWQRDAVSFELLADAAEAQSRANTLPHDSTPLPQRHHVTASPYQPSDGWPRGRDELGILREQLVSLLSGWFDARRRRTLLVLALPEAGWSSRRRIGQALQEALGSGQLQASLFDWSEAAGTTPASVQRLASGFEQCVVLADPTSVVLQALWLADRKGLSGLVSFGPLPDGVLAGLGQEIPACSVLGADEVGPLIAMETPLSRTVLSACQANRSLREQLLPEGFRPAGMYQPFPRGPWVEQGAGQVLVSSWGVSPVAGYGLGWRGEVLSFSRVCQALRREEALPARQIRRLTRVLSTGWKLPLVVLGAV